MNRSMLVFNCTQAACDFFSRTVKGRKVSHAQPAPSPEWQNERFENADGQALQAEQWQLHCVMRRRKPILLAMHMPTRFAMLFTDVRRNDLAGFMSCFIERWLNELACLGIDLDVLDEADRHDAAARFMSRHGEYRVFARSDRSVLAHVSQVMDGFDLWLDQEALPVNAVEGGLFDKWSNGSLRSIGKGHDYFHPDEAMFLHEREHSGGLTDASRDEIARRFMQLRKKRLEATTQAG